MTVNELIKSLSAEVISLHDGEREPEAVYAGDLLSWVMGRAEAGSLWITIMTNKNVLAVASLHDFAAVLITDGAELEPEFAELAKEKEINVLRTDMSTYSACLAVAKALGTI